MTEHPSHDDLSDEQLITAALQQPDLSSLDRAVIDRLDAALREVTRLDATVQELRDTVAYLTRPR